MRRDNSLGWIKFNRLFVTRKGPRAAPLPFGSLLVSYADAVTLLLPSPEPSAREPPKNKILQVPDYKRPLLGSIVEGNLSIYERRAF